MTASQPSRLSFARFLLVLAVLTTGVLAWRSGMVPGLRAARASAVARLSPRGGPHEAATSAPAGAQDTVALRAAHPTLSPASSALIDPAGDTVAVQRFIDLGLPIYCGGSRGNYVALTFDDGPGPYTQQTIQTLRAAHDTATFFLVGRNLSSWGSLPRQESTLGAVGDHTWNHVPLARLSSSAEQFTEVARTKQALEAITGKPVQLFRPPEGSRNQEVDQLVHSLGLLEVVWSVDTQDSAGVGTQRTYANVVTGLRPGAIILMHENRGGTLAGLTSILQAVARAGYRTVTVPQLLRLDPPTLDQVHKSAAAGACVQG